VPVSTASAKSHALQHAGLIRYSRGHINILSREGLEDYACECYSTIHAKTDKVMGWGEDRICLKIRHFGISTSALRILLGRPARCPLLCRCYGASGEGMAPSALFNGYRWSAPMSQRFRFDPSRSLAALDSG
jgi:hypothetical protein